MTLIFFIIFANTLPINNIFFDDYRYVSGQVDKINLNSTKSLNIQDIPIQKVKVGDIDMAYKILGKGDPLLLISGSGNVMDVWPSIMLDKLSSNHKVIIFDNRGVGNTTSGIKPFSIQQFANDTAGLLDSLKIQKADVLGFSMASFIAQQLYIIHPEKINSLILYAASCGGKESIPQNPSTVKILSDFVNNRTYDANAFLSVTFPKKWMEMHPNYFESIPKSSEILPSTTLVKQFNAVEKWLSTDWDGVCNQLLERSVPALIITGTGDVAVPAANSLILVQKIPAAWLVQIAEAGHGLIYQYPEQFTNIVETFLQNNKL